MKKILRFYKLSYTAPSNRKNVDIFKSIFLTFAFVVILIFSANAQTIKIGVNVSVTADDSIKSNVESYIKRELRALNDIDLYTSKPDYEIRLIAINPSNAVAISVIVIHKYDFTEYLNNSLSSKTVGAKTKEEFIKTFAVQESVVQYFLRSDSASNLEQLCKSIVASVDTDTFERERTLNRIIFGDSKKSPPNARLKDELPDLSKYEVKQNPQPKQDNQPVFERRYVGGNKPPQITVKNDANVILTLNFGSLNYTVPAGQTQTIETTQGGNYNFTASAPGVESLTGQKNFEVGYVYTWRFYIVTTRR